jgi:hydrogenase small subunit
MGALEILDQWKRPDFLNQDVRRRDFLKFCGTMAMLLGLTESYIPRIAEALETTMRERRPCVVWREFQDCAGNTESFLRANSPSVAQAVLDSISLDYHETLMAAAGHQAEEAMMKAIEESKGKVIVVVEGSIPTGENGAYCTIAGKSAIQIIRELEPYALVYVAVGTCATFGGLPKAHPNPTGAVAVEDIIRSKPVINLPGCPANPDVLMGVLCPIWSSGACPISTTRSAPSLPMESGFMTPVSDGLTSMPDSLLSLLTTSALARVIACTRWVARARRPITSVPPSAGI